MIFHDTPLKGCYIIEQEPYIDHRGSFARVFCKKEFSQIGHQKEFVQFNHSVNPYKGTVRGMHYQKPPHSENKLIYCIKGAVYDVAIDMRKDSPTFRHYFALELSAANRKMLYIPEGFAHGFQVLEDMSELFYYHTAFYRPDFEEVVRFDDPAIGIEWPMPPMHLSEKDLKQPFLTQPN